MAGSKPLRFARIADEGRVAIGSDADIVVAREKGRKLAAQCGFPSTDLAVIATAISELARNIVHYAGRGAIILRLVDEKGRRGVEVVAADDGPGIPDVTLAMYDGYLTSKSLGLGLPCVRRLMDDFEIMSDHGKRTAVHLRNRQPQTAQTGK